jgi:hypothetical protein
VSWARLIDLLKAQEACLEGQDFARHREALQPQIEALLASLAGGPAPTEAEREQALALLDTTLQRSVQRVAQTGASIRRSQQQKGQKPAQLIDRRG